MKVTPPPLTAAARVLGLPPLKRIERIGAVVSVALGLGLAGQASAGTAAAASTDAPANLRVGHTVKQITVPGSVLGEQRVVHVHLWYPADRHGLSERLRTVYRSALWRRCSSTSIPPAMHCLPALPLTQQPWTPLSWEVEAEVAREDAPIDPEGPAFPVIVFSHGSTNDPIDYAHTLELIAGAGFVVAAPYHVNNTQDDARIDYINQQANARLFIATTGCRRDQSSKARQTVPRPTFRPTWLIESATSGRFSMNFRVGSGTASTFHVPASWGTHAGPSPRSLLPAVPPSGVVDRRQARAVRIH